MIPVEEPRDREHAVLVVEDRQAVRDALRGTIEMLGYRTIGAGNGEEALRLLEADPHDIDLVISDVVMPALGGVALLHALRQRGDDRPVILLTGHSMGKDLDALLEQGLTAWLSKPPSMEHLAGAIAEALHAEADAHRD